MQDPRIQEIASFKKLMEDAGGMAQLRHAFPFMKPALKLIGVDVTKMEALLNDPKVDELIQQTNEMVSMPDRFNKLFAVRGWIMYEMLNYEVARAAVLEGETGDLDGAEQLLVDHYDEEGLKYHLIWMRHVKAFCPRIALAEKARTDYLEGRYHACVPVVLAILDGTVNDLGPRNFFAQGVSLEAWDSISAHSMGLEQLSKVLGASRTTTTIEPITLPYRHDIQHGMDLGYDNKLVAAKAWAALFSIRVWAIKVGKGQTQEPPPEPKKTFADTLRQIRANNEFKAQLEAWRPRALQIGVEIPVSGQPEEYGEGTPERKLAEFFYYWGRRNYGYMARCMSPMAIDQPQSGKGAGEMRELYADKQLVSWTMLSLEDSAAAVSTAQVRMVYQQAGMAIDREIHIRLIYKDSNGKSLVRSMPDGNWGIVSGHP